MSTYSVTATPVTSPANGVLLTLKFGLPGQNTEIVKDALASLAEAALTGGSIVLLNGPASLPVAIAIGHGVSHLFGSVACFDPKLNGYVVAVSHDARWAVGDLLAAAGVS